jgi:hypothetical protein
MFDRNEERTEPLSDLERRLRSWEPASGGLDRDCMLFEAGRAAAGRTVGPGRSVRLWRLATAAAVVAALGLGQGWRTERLHRQAVELLLAAELPRPVPTAQARPSRPPRHEPSVTPIDPSSYLALVRRTAPPGPAPLPGPPGDTSGQPIDPGGVSSQPPLRPHDLDRVLSL